MARYKYGKLFKKGGQWWRYRYTNGKRSTRKLTRYIRKRDR